MTKCSRYGNIRHIDTALALGEGTDGGGGRTELRVYDARDHFWAIRLGCLERERESAAAVMHCVPKRRVGWGFGDDMSNEENGRPAWAKYN